MPVGIILIMLTEEVRPAHYGGGEYTIPYAGILDGTRGEVPVCSNTSDYRHNVISWSCHYNFYDGL